MKTHHIFYTIFISLFSVGLGVLVIFAFFPNILKPRDVDLTGKTFIYDNINVEWADGLTETEKETLLEGSTEEEYFAGVKLLMGSSLNGCTIEFTSKTSLTIIADQNEDVYSYVVSGNTITIISPEGESQSFIYDDSNLIMNLPENELTLMLSVKITIICIDSEVVPPAESGVDLTGKKYIYDDITIHGWIDGLTQDEKNALLNDQTQQEYFDGLEWGYSIGMFNSNSSIEFIDANNAVVVAPIMFGSNSFKYLADETTVVINYQMGMQLPGVYDEESLVINLDDVDNGVNVSFLFVKDDGTTQPEPSTPPADGELNLVGKTFAYSGNMDVEWAEGVTEEQKESALDGQTEEDFFNEIKGYYSDNLDGVTVYILDNATIRMSDANMEEIYSYVINGNTMTLTDEYGDSLLAVYENNTLIIISTMFGLDDLNLIYTFIENA